MHPPDFWISACPVFSVHRPLFIFLTFESLNTMPALMTYGFLSPARPLTETQTLIPTHSLASSPGSLKGISNLAVQNQTLDLFLMTVNGNFILLSGQSENLGIIFDSSLPHLHAIHPYWALFRKLFTIQLLLTIFTGTISCSNYCNRLPAGVPIPVNDPFHHTKMLWFLCPSVIKFEEW